MPQDPSTALRFVQDDRLFYSKLVTEFPCHSAPQTFVIPSIVEESYAVPQDPSTALRFVQDDCFFLNSKLATRKPKTAYQYTSLLVWHIQQLFLQPLKSVQIKPSSPVPHYPSGEK